MQRDQTPREDDSQMQMRDQLQEDQDQDDFDQNGDEQEVYYQVDENGQPIEPMEYEHYEQEYKEEEDDQQDEEQDEEGYASGVVD